MIAVIFPTIKNPKTRNEAPSLYSNMFILSINTKFKWIKKYDIMLYIPKEATKEITYLDAVLTLSTSILLHRTIIVNIGSTTLRQRNKSTRYSFGAEFALKKMKNPIIYNKIIKTIISLIPRFKKTLSLEFSMLFLFLSYYL
ncbi:hypothetical protein CMO93_01300 [Candidatus Woesearchaeota archaeon]|nr:hypothetical protein [Candidatus Woesearchaeota archaeon]